MFDLLMRVRVYAHHRYVRARLARCLALLLRRVCAMRLCSTAAQAATARKRRMRGAAARA